MKKIAACLAALAIAGQHGVSAVTMEECVASIPADSTQVCEYANANGEVCWMRNDPTTGDLIFQCETKQWTALSCGSHLVSTCPQYDQAGQCLFVNCAGMTCRLTSPGRYGSKHLSCDRSNLDAGTTTTTTTTTTQPPIDRRQQNLNDEGGIMNANCESVVWGQTRESCRSTVNSNNFGKCQYVVLPSSVVNNNELTICVWQCCGDDNFAQCTTQCETRLLSGDSNAGPEEGEETLRRDMNNEDELESEDESVAPRPDNSQWGLSRGGESRIPENAQTVHGFAARSAKNVLQQKSESVIGTVPLTAERQETTNVEAHTDIAISAPQSAEGKVRNQF